MGKGSLKKRVIAVERELMLLKRGIKQENDYRINELNRRMDRLVELVTEHDAELEDRRNKSDKRKKQ